MSPKNINVDKKDLEFVSEYEDIVDCYVEDGEVIITDDSKGIFRKILKGAVSFGNIDVLWDIAIHPKRAAKFFKPGEIALIIAAVVYVLTPLDAIPDFLPLGFLDDIGVINYAIAKSGSLLNQYRAEFMGKNIIKVD